MPLTDDRWIDEISTGLLDGSLTPAVALARVEQKSREEGGPWPPTEQVIERVRQAGRRLERLALLLMSARREVG